ncbi:23S rRNA pseudouridine2604 synthase [Algoriphagus ornithinivorans]|uniref:Pseudouridine synthase n=1 Tax=Algoriphagus ornithinivorans TaxID=226506 RepID=A0A1I5K0P9_9BACT|nr:MULTISPECIES: 23S rRNA pseudouridine(2604) synthase RluF [Algoriphagus]SFO78612.1 23S rRNA pseudouridine2604 synthase [Algoriphagus ornithinivorans]
MEKDQYIRINKYLSEVGFCSRREADKLLEQGRITLNGKIPELGTKVGPSDKVAVDGKPVGKPIQEHTYIAFNKPVGIVSTTDTKGEKNNIIDYIGHPVRIFPVGRLDKDSEGLIFLTSEGDIVNKILRASNNHEKEYVVTVDKPIDKRFIQRMSDGIPILGTVTKKCKVEQISRFKFRIVLTQGLNRQIRRMCEYLGYQVKQLIRVRIMNVHLDLPTGKWRDLTEKELKELNRLIADSSKTAE